METFNPFSSRRGLHYHCQYTDSYTVKWHNDDKLERIWKEAVVDLAFAWKGWRKPRNASTRIAGVAAEIRTESLSNTSPDRYRCANLLSDTTQEVKIKAEGEGGGGEGGGGGGGEQKKE
jgi:hypothetical protein